MRPDQKVPQTEPSNEGQVRDPADSYERVAIINLDAISANVKKIVTIAWPAKVMAVVKADGYGHGAIESAQTALEAGATWLGTAHVSEALHLRKNGLKAPTLAWLHTPRTDFEGAIRNKIDLGVSGWDLEPIVQAAEKVGKEAKIHLKVDTGLGRNGCPWDKWDSLVRKAVKHQDQGLLKIVGIFSHLSVADEPHRPETLTQIQRFNEAMTVAQNAGVGQVVRHLANTAATLTRPESHYDMVRTGIGIYGLSPFANRTSTELGLRPAMTLQAYVANAKRVPAHQGISYGLTYRTSRPSTLALVPVGYADGIPREATGVPVRVGNRTYPEVGRIGMDQFVLDLGSDIDPDTVIGKKVVLFGEPGDPSVDLWAAAAGTINYEVVTRISARVPRVYVTDEMLKTADIGIIQN